MQYRRSGRRTSSADKARKSTRRGGWLHRLLAGATEGVVASTPHFAPERLEERRLLHTFNNFGTGAVDAINFYSGQQQICQIAFFDVSFEAVFVKVDPTTGGVIPTPLGGEDLVQPSNPEPTLGANLYSIYVVQSNADSFISVYTFTPKASTPPDPQNVVGTPTPFAGAVPTFGVTTYNGGVAVSAPATGTGGVLIGAIDPVSTPSPTLITSVSNFAGEGEMPAPANGVLTPGVTVLSTDGSSGVQNNFGNMLIGGTVTGSVSIGGNISEFYAGNILTGDSSGDPATNYARITGNLVTFNSPANPSSVRVSPGNFSVAGDLGALLTTGSIGTDSTFIGAQGTPLYLTNFDLTVGGKLGELKVGNNEKGDATSSFAGTIEVGNSPYIDQQTPYPTAAADGSINVIGNSALQTEIETSARPNPDAVWQDGTLDLLNNTPADAEFLNSTPVTDPSTGKLVRDSHGNLEFSASVDGDLLNGGADVQDYYSAALLAGQPVQFTAVDTSNTTAAAGTLLDVLVYDPSGRLIASSVGFGGGTRQFTPDRPGVYLFEVTEPASNQVTATYNLTVQGIPQQGIAGISIGEDYSDVGVDAGIILGNSDIGAIEVGGSYTSTTAGPTPTTSSNGTAVTASVKASTSILVASGNLDALVASQIGVEVGTPDVLYGSTLSVPNGSVGLVQSTTGLLGLNCQFDPNYLNEVTPQFVTDDQNASAIGGFIQTIDAATTLQCRLAVNAGIGTIRSADMATTTASYIDVNADNIGNDGIIDLIDTGQLGTNAAGGPGIVTHDGGDVRYLNATSAFRPLFFGAGEDDPVVYNAGQTVVLTDNAGNTINITPVGPITTTVTTITTTPAVNAPAGVTTTTTTSTVTTGPQITVFSYPVIDKAGVIPISISSSGGMTISDSGANGSEVNIANVSIRGVGSPIVNKGTDAYGNTTIEQTPPTTNVSAGTTTTTTTTANPDGSSTTVTLNVSGGGTSTFLDLLLGGPEVINVLQITATCNVGDVLGGVTSIINNTLGEVASIIVQTSMPEAAGLPANVGTILVHGNLGYTTPRATAAVDLPRAVIAEGNQYPFVQQHTGVVVGNFLTHQGSAVNIDAYGAVGNVLVLGTIESLVANYGVSEHIAGASPIPGQMSGIVGPIVVGDPVPITAPITTFGTLISCDIGQGIAFSGSGTVGLSGIYVSGAIGVIDNVGNSGGAIRGNIICEDDAHAIGGYAPGNAIGLIKLNNASIIGATIGTIDNLASPTTFYDNFLPMNFFTLFTSATSFNLTGGGTPPFTSPFIYEIGSIVVSGRAGIMGSLIYAADLGPIVVNDGGFGFLSTDIFSAGVGRVAGITASGYGIRDSEITGDGYLGRIVATGGGPTVSVLNYPIDVRASDLPLPGSATPGFVAVDPNFGVAPNLDTDLNAELGTSGLQPNIPGVTDTGVVQDCIFQGQESFAGLVAQKVRTIEPVFSQGAIEPTPPVANIPVVGIAYPMQIAFPLSVGTIRIYQETDGLQITTGHLVGFHPSSSVSRVGISVAGTINSLRINGNFGQYITNPQTGQQIPDSYIDAGGPSGRIGSLIVTGDLNGTVSATGVIGSIFVGHDVEAGIIARGQTTGLALGSLHVQGGVRDGALVINGSAGSIVINGTLGTSTASLTVQGNANLVSVGANHKLKNSDLALALTVTGYLRNLTVYGTISGSVTVGSDLSNLRLTGTGAASVILTGGISVGGKIQNATVTGGSIGGSVVAANTIGNFTISKGSLLAPAIVESQIAGIGFFRITGGLGFGLYGSLLAESGRNDRIDISGNLGDGVNTATVTALTGSTFRVRGTVATNANVQVSGQLNLLEVDGNIETGAVIAAHPLLKQKIKGSNTGTITVV